MAQDPPTSRSASRRDPPCHQGQYSGNRRRISTRIAMATIEPAVTQARVAPTTPAPSQAAATTDTVMAIAWIEEFPLNRNAVSFGFGLKDSFSRTLKW